MKSSYVISILLLLCVQICAGQSGLYINGADASLNVPAGTTLSIAGSLGVTKCDPVLKVRFAGTLFVTDSIKCNDALEFFPSSTATAKQCRAIFQSNRQSAITGSVSPNFWELEINKGQGNAVKLLNSILVRDTITFSSGFFYPNNNKVILQDAVGAPSVLNHPWIKNERNGSQFLSISSNDTAQIIYNTIYTGTLNFSAANIGFSLSGPVNIGSNVTVKRGFKTQNNCANLTLASYFEIESPGHVLTNNTLTLNNKLTDITNFTLLNTNLSKLTPYFSNKTDINWTPTNFSLPNGPLANITGSLNSTMLIPLSELRHKNMLADSTSFRIVVANPDCASPPISALVLDTIHICSGDSVVLDAGNNGSVAGYNLRYEWTTSTAAFTRTLIAKPTTLYQKFKLKLLDARGCAAYDSIVVAPTAPFPQIQYLNYLNACVGDSTTIKDSVTIASGTYNNSYTFSNSDTRITNLKKFKHLLSTPGTYSLELTSTSNFGCTTKSTANGITVYNLPSVSFSTTYNCATKQMNFASTSVSNHTTLVISSNQWKFSVTDSTSGATAIKTFSTAGIYTVQLISSSNFGCKNSAVQAFTVYPFNTAQFSKNNTCLNDTCYLKNQSICLTGSCSLLWSLGDNTSSTADSLKKIYANAGLKNIKLKINAQVGCPDSVTIPVFIHPLPTTQFALSSTTLCSGDIILATNNSSIASGNINSSIWNLNGQLLSTNWNSTVSPTQTGTNVINLRLQSDSGCVSETMQTITMYSLPNASYYGASVCKGSVSTFTSLSQQAGNTFSFYPQSFAPTITSSLQVFSYTYPQAGVVSTSLVVSSVNGCTASTSQNYTVKANPTIPFTGTISTCGTQYSLNAQNAGSTFFWLPTNQTTQTLNCTQSNLYQVVITGSNNCQIQSQVFVKLNAEVKPQLGNDTTVCGSYNLDAGYAGSLFNWNTGASTQTVMAQQSGTYVVSVTDQNNCTGVDSIYINVLPVPQVVASADIVQCRPSSPFTLSVVGSAQNYSWSTGQTGSSIQTSVSGNYLVVGTSTNGCKASDTVLVNVLQTPSINLGGDYWSCDKKIIDIISNGNSILWSNGSTISSFTVETSQKIWVQLTNTVTSCYDSDTTNVTIFGYPEFNLGNDTLSCSANLISIGASVPNCTYLWSNTLTSPSITPQSSGLYALKVTNVGGCSKTDYINITKINSPVIQLGPSIRYLCSNSPFTLNCGAAGTYSWSKDKQALTNTNTITITITEAGQYNIKVSDSGCSAEDSVLVIASNQTVQANFLAATYDTINRVIKFVNLSKPSITSSQWDFGDGTLSSETHPEHTWFLPTDYSVTLLVSNNYCSDKITKQLSLLFREALLTEQENAPFQFETLVIFPNPNSGTYSYYTRISKVSDLRIELITLTGEVIAVDEIENCESFTAKYNFEKLAAGMYLIKTTARNKKTIISKIEKLIIQD